MIRNNKIHNILDIIGASKSMELDKCIHSKKNWKCSFKCFPWFCQSLLGPKKSKCDVPSGTTQGWACSTPRSELGGKQDKIL
jgi:hypothetical protein